MKDQAMQGEDKPDNIIIDMQGYVSWHPKYGWFEDFHATKRMAKHEMQEADIKDGWRIRPVKLTFLDED